MATRQQQSRPGYAGSLLALENDPRFTSTGGGGGGGGGGGLTPVAVTGAATGAATATAGQFVLANAAGGAFTVTAPAAPTAGTVFGVKKTDTTGNQVSIVPAAGSTATIDGDSSCVLMSPEAAATLVYDGTTWQIQNTAVVNAGSDTVQNLWTPTYTAQMWYDRRSAFGQAGNLGLSSATAGAVGASSVVAGSIIYVPMYAHRALTIDTVGLLSGTTAPTAGSAVRVGLYANSSSNAPTGAALFSSTYVVTLTAAAGTPFTAAAAGTIPKGWSWWALSYNATSAGSLMATTQNASPLLGLSAFTYANFATQAGTLMYQEAPTTVGALNATATPTAVTFTGTALVDVFFRVVG